MKRARVKVQTYRVALKKDRVLRLAEGTANDPIKVERIAHAMLADSPVERLVAIFLGGQSQVLGVAEIATSGQVSSCTVDAAFVFKAALAANASGFVLAHNHPSGDPTPSDADVALTRKVRDLGEQLGIVLVDHVVVTREPGEFRSMFNMGLLKGGVL